MADNNTRNLNISSISADDLNDLEQLLSDLKAKARASHDTQAAFMHGVYVRLIAIVSPIVVNTHARMERDHLADQRKMLKALKESQRPASDGTQQIGQR